MSCTYLSDLEVVQAEGWTSLLFLRPSSQSKLSTRPAAAICRQTHINCHMHINGSQCQRSRHNTLNVSCMSSGMRPACPFSLTKLKRASTNSWPGWWERKWERVKGVHILWRYGSGVTIETDARSPLSCRRRTRWGRQRCQTPCRLWVKPREGIKEQA